MKRGTSGAGASPVALVFEDDFCASRLVNAGLQLSYTGRMTRRAKAVYVTVFAVIAVPSVAIWYIAHPSRRDPYPFLTGHRPVATKFSGPGSFGPKEVRVYTWNESWQEVLISARRDMAAFGLSEERRSKGQSEHTFLGGRVYRSGLEGTNADLMISVLPGRNHELRLSKPMSDDDPRWVTVLVQESLDESWSNVIRYSLYPIPD